VEKCGKLKNTNYYFPHNLCYFVEKCGNSKTRVMEFPIICVILWKNVEIQKHELLFSP
jgi:hypothetical protein